MRERSHLPECIVHRNVIVSQGGLNSAVKAYSNLTFAFVPAFQEKFLSTSRNLLYKYHHLLP